jgi:hypothetical protein
MYEYRGAAPPFDNKTAEESAGYLIDHTEQHDLPKHGKITHEISSLNELVRLLDTLLGNPLFGIKPLGSPEEIASVHVESLETQLKTGMSVLKALQTGNDISEVASEHGLTEHEVAEISHSAKNAYIRMRSLR